MSEPKLPIPSGPTWLLEDRGLGYYLEFHPTEPFADVFDWTSYGEGSEGLIDVISVTKAESRLLGRITIPVSVVQEIYAVDRVPDAQLCDPVVVELIESVNNQLLPLLHAQFHDT